MASLTQTLKDVNKRFKGVRTEHINKLIDINKTLLKNNGETKSNKNIPSECKLILESGGTLLQILNQQMDKSGERVDLFNPDQVLGIVSFILVGVGNNHWVLAGISMIGHLLTKVGDMAENRNECLEILQYMVDVAYRIKILKPLVRNEEKQLEKGFAIIVKGSMLCAKQLRSKNFFRFLMSSPDKNNLSKLKSEIDRLKVDLLGIAQIAMLRNQRVRVHTKQPAYPDDPGIYK
ncbi:hypothetical protein SUGI_0352320 [Cryptomeria japonica]|nr:hypothetical protein SUGI_0352320 [Cryptomeria japonica]